MSKWCLSVCCYQKLTVEHILIKLTTTTNDLKTDVISFSSIVSETSRIRTSAGFVSLKCVASHIRDYIIDFLRQ